MQRIVGLNVMRNCGGSVEEGGVVSDMFANMDHFSLSEGIGEDLAELELL